jgi:hypothetical protein
MQNILEPVENMPLSEDNQRWVLEQIRQATQPNGFKKFVDRLRYWGLPAACIGGVLALIAMVITLGLFATNKASQEAEFRGKTTQELSTIENRLTGVENSLKLLPAQISSNKLSTLPKKELKNHRQELADAKKTLLSVPQSTPNFWPVTFQTITLLSQADFENYEKIASLPTTVVHNVTSTFPGPIDFGRNQKIILSGHVEGMIIRNCVVVFAPNVVLVNDIFINCAFILPVTGENPPKVLQEIGKTLLAGDLSHVTLNAS